jgi:tetratricopeptide (TPR) repeat protein
MNDRSAAGGRAPRLAGIAFVAIGLLLASLALRQVGNPDTGFHLKVGESILSGNGWPVTDSFTFTLRGHPYVDTSWGYQVLAAAVLRAGGVAGLVLFHALLILAAFAIVFRTTRLEAADRLSLAAFLWLGILASEIRFEARPELLSYVFLALVLHLLQRRAHGRVAPLWLLPLIHLIWANSHSLFILGWGAMACFLVGLGIRDRRIDRRLLAASASSVAVTLLNPYGWRGAVFPFTLATRLRPGNAFADSIGEFISPFRLQIPEGFPFYPKLPIYSFRVLAVLIVLSLPLLLRRKRWDLLLLALAYFPLAAGMIRNMPVLVLVALPGLVWSLPAEALIARAAGSGAAKPRIRTALFCLLALLALALGLRVAHDSYYIAARRPTRFGLGWNRLVLPLDAAEFAVRAGLRGPVLNHLNFGGTLMWALPQPVFIDGRLEVVGEDFYEKYRRLFDSEEALEEAVGRYDLRWVVFPYATNPAALSRLSRDQRWTLAYVDGLSVIFVRRDSGLPVDPALPSRIAEVPGRQNVRFLPGLGGPPIRGRLGRWLEGLLRRENYPSEDFGLGLFHFYRGELLQAERRFSEAIRKSGGAYFEMYADLAAALYRQGRIQEGRACDRVVLEADPGNRLALERLSSPATPIPR